MRRPDFIIGDPSNPYMLRWWVIPRNRWFNIYLHHILRDDDDRALHDHPWASLSVVLSGRYLERTPNGNRTVGPGGIILRGAEYSHRLEVLEGPCWSLFFTGPVVRTWGFHCPKGWIPWQQFVDTTNYGNIGKGCGET